MFLTLMRLQQRRRPLEEQLQFSQDSSVAPVVVFPSCCCSSSVPERRSGEGEDLRRQSWASGMLEDDDVPKLHKKKGEDRRVLTTGVFRKLSRGVFILTFSTAIL